MTDVDCKVFVERIKQVLEENKINRQVWVTNHKDWRDRRQEYNDKLSTWHSKSGEFSRFANYAGDEADYLSARPQFTESEPGQEFTEIGNVGQCCRSIKNLNFRNPSDSDFAQVDNCLRRIEKGERDEEIYGSTELGPMSLAGLRAPGEVDWGDNSGKMLDIKFIIAGGVLLIIIVILVFFILK